MSRPFIPRLSSFFFRKQCYPETRPRVRNVTPHKPSLGILFNHDLRKAPLQPTPSPMPIPEDPSPQLSTVLKWFEHVENWDIDGALKLTTDDFWLEAFPSPNGEHRMNKSEVIQYAETELASFTGGKVVAVRRFFS